ncbi:hypothetical protein WA026_005756 [Henosepilachna vigintioctopunctata]|uniref:Magnesium-dependent phosphatase 1 n=1 Tax=Henosepilachna vigintioctopunctata TaxID=420089 RepID=A0AAW1TVZ2_9CUCU
MSNNSRPLLIIFDLDYTLWPFWVDTHVVPPFSKKANGDIVDRHEQKITSYPDSPEILKNLFDNGYTLAVASRTSEIKGARQLLDLFGWNKYFSYIEIFPGRKTCHFEKIKSQSKIEFKDMLFFDDEHRNIRDLEEIGVVSVLVENGVTHEVIQGGLKKYQQKYPA